MSQALSSTPKLHKKDSLHHSQNQASDFSDSNNIKVINVSNNVQYNVLTQFKIYTKIWGGVVHYSMSSSFHNDRTHNIVDQNSNPIVFLGRTYILGDLFVFFSPLENGYFKEVSKFNLDEQH